MELLFNILGIIAVIGFSIYLLMFILDIFWMNRNYDKEEKWLTCCPNCNTPIFAKKDGGWKSAYCPTCGLKGDNLKKEITDD